jgi:alanyl-tRNA synthetase
MPYFCATLWLAMLLNYSCGLCGCSFDFNLPRPMKPEEIAEVERLVNTWVQQAAPAETKIMGLEVSFVFGVLFYHFHQVYPTVPRLTGL